MATISPARIAEQLNDEKSSSIQCVRDYGETRSWLHYDRPELFQELLNKESLCLAGEEDG